MATLKQIDANRRNAELSTGPVTPEGKQRAAANALQSGIYAESEVIFTERREDLETLKTEYHVRFQPATPERRDMVDSLVRSAWLLRRFAASEASLFSAPFAPDFSECTDLRVASRLFSMHNRLDLLQRRINATERNYHRSLKALLALEPGPEPSNEAAPDPQPQVSKPTSEKLASFPQNQSQPALLRESSVESPCLRVEEKPEPANASAKLASFPQIQKTPDVEAVEPKPEVRNEPEIDAA